MARATKPKTSIDRSDPPKLDSARASAELFGRSFGQICFGKNFQDSAKTEASVRAEASANIGIFY